MNFENFSKPWVAPTLMLVSDKTIIASQFKMKKRILVESSLR